MEQRNFENNLERSGLESLDPKLQKFVTDIQQLEQEKELKKREQELTQDPKVRAHLEGEIRELLLKIQSLQKEKLATLEQKFTILTEGTTDQPPQKISKEEAFDRALQGTGELAANDKLRARILGGN
jgi:plasmid replication initiation protein